MSVFYQRKTCHSKRSGCCGSAPCTAPVGWNSLIIGRWRHGHRDGAGRQCRLFVRQQALPRAALPMMDETILPKAISGRFTGHEAGRRGLRPSRRYGFCGRCLLPDFAKQPEASFVYLENRNTAGFEFATRSFPQAVDGRWLRDGSGRLRRRRRHRPTARLLRPLPCQRRASCYKPGEATVWT